MTNASFSTRTGSFLVPMGLAILAACSSNPVGPTPQPAVCGWAVGFNEGGYALILHTIDGGASWFRQGDSTSVPDVSLDAVRAVDSLHAWVCGAPTEGYATILSTSDAGATWTRMGEAGTIPDVELQTIFALDEDRIWCAGSGNSIVRTLDGGATWTSISSPRFDGVNWEGIHVQSENSIWVCGGAGDGNGWIAYTDDGGLSWTPQGDSLLLTGYMPISITAWGGYHVFLVGGHYTVARSDNGGLDWELCLPEDLERTPESDDANGICQIGPETLLMCLDYGKIYRTTDWGDTWTELPTGFGGYLLLRICAMDDGQRAWAAGLSQDPGIIISTSDGANWTQQTIPTTGSMTDIHFVGSRH